uniref:CRISPR system Cms protein Csm2 n=1 Tax=Thermodesulfobacterium geofontis TaxID=1295609 RepID=A0A7C4JRG2_9BACT
MNERNFPQKRKSSVNPEEGWRSEVEKFLGKDFVQRVLDFHDLEIEEFKDFNNKIQKFVEDIANNITTSSLRKIYDLIKNSEDASDLVFKLPYMVYMVGKEKDAKREALGKLYIALKDPIENIKDERQVRNIKKFAEALVAYQKLYGGKEER